MAAGRQTFEQGDYDEAESQVLRALQEAENFGPEDPRLATILENYAELLRDMNRETEATEMEARAQAIRAQIAQ